MSVFTGAAALLFGWLGDRDDGVLFHRYNPPALEVCADSLEQSWGTSDVLIRTSTIDAAVALSTAAGARWLTVYISTCTDPLTPDVVRLRVDTITPPDGRLAITDLGAFDDDTVAYAEILVFPFPESDDVVTIAHELMHAQGVDHTCTLPSEERRKGDPAYCELEDTGSLMFPSRNWGGAGVGGLSEKADRVYRD